MSPRIAAAAAVAALLAAGGGAAYYLWGKADSDPDTVTVTGLASGETAYVYVTGSRFGGCFCLFGETQSHVELGNASEDGSQIALFAPGHGITFRPEVTWTRYVPENQDIAVAAIRPLPLKIWVLAGGSATVTLATESQNFLQTLLANTARPTGIQLQPRPIEETPTSFLTADCGETFSNLKTLGFFHEDAVNVYFTQNFTCPTGACLVAGFSCGDGRVNFITSIGTGTTLAHEVGHALLGSQDHWVAGEANPNNVMMSSDATDRSHLSAGQALWMNLDHKSVLNQLENKPGMDCSRVCPILTLDSVASGCELGPLQKPPYGPAFGTFAAWRDCIDCTDGELTRLLASMTPAKVTEMSRALLEHPRSPEFDKSKPFEGNLRARQQRRALMALTILAKQGDKTALNAISEAHTSRSSYRIDVSDALVDAMNQIQGAQKRF